mmetsp:Transcript_4801/g.17978  ORF Transcript_4801/g.17978 Transcript_4801/m.17978 type:complete len:316 (+) Transcript_4801:189-1136(+)
MQANIRLQPSHRRFSALCVILLVIYINRDFLSGGLRNPDYSWLATSNTNRHTSLVPSVKDDVLLKSLTRELPWSLENSLRRHDDCVEDARVKSSLSENQCFRCHSIALDIYNNVKLNFYWDYIKLNLNNSEDCKTVCEVGFNRGDSAILWLEACPKAKVYSFTLNSRWYTEPGKKCVEEKYADRLVYVEGDSTVTIPMFMKENPNLRCDVIHIDGCKNTDCRAKDIRNLLPSSTTSSLWLADDMLLKCLQHGQDPSRPHLCRQLALSDGTEVEDKLAELYMKFASEQHMETSCVSVYKRQTSYDSVCALRSTKRM